MGYSYDRRGRLVCDSCGAVGDTCKRTCPHTVLGDSHRSAARHAMPYCPAPALCTACYTGHGGTRGLHDRCAEPAAQAQAAADAIETLLDAGELLALSAWGDWHPTVPTGKTGVLYGGKAYSRHTYVLVDAATYAQGRDGAGQPVPLSQTPHTPWTGPHATKGLTR